MSIMRVHDDYIENNRYLLSGRSQCYQHDDWKVYYK